MRRSVPVRTFSDWGDPPPGFFEADLVAHSGPRANGSFIQTLVLTDIATGLPEGPLRNAVEKNRADEVAAPSHLDLFEQFATHYGATGSAPSPAMSRLLGAYRECIDRGTSAAVAGLLAYEVQGAEIATTKATGLVEHYGAPRPATEFWRLHGEVEDDHATWIVDATDVVDVDVDDAIYGAHLVADAWWAFLDERALQAA